MNQLHNARVIDNEFVPVYETDKGHKVVIARELHESLLVSTRFNDWIQRNLISVGFIDGKDFYSFLSNTNGRPAQGYIITLDTAKHIAMIQRSEIGMKIRQKFIDLEKVVLQSQPQTIEDLIIMQANSVKELKQEVSQAQQKLTTVSHRLDNLDRIDTIGDQQQRLNKMIKRYAWDNGINMGVAWRQFDQSFNTAFRTNLTAKRNNYKEKHGLRELTRPQYLSLVNQLEDAIRVADKMLNQQRQVI